MKTPASNENTTSSQSSQPFFNKKGEGSFLSSTNEQEQPFFSQSPAFQKSPSNSSFSVGNNAAHTPFFRPNTVVQTKLTINEPGDKYEQEADAMADHVMRMPAFTPSAERSFSSPSGRVEIVQRNEKEEEEQVQRKAIAAGNFCGSEPIMIQRKCAICDEEQKVQRQEMEEEDLLQTKSLMRKATYGAGYTASPQLTSQLNSSKGGGDPLPGQTLASMNHAFGADFSTVRVHTGSQAVEMSQDIQAKAFTHGSDVYFNREQYNPESSEGKWLLGHELTHVMQQRNNKRIQLFPKGGFGWVSSRDYYGQHIDWIENLTVNDLKGQIDQEYSDTALDKSLERELGTNKEYRKLRKELRDAEKKKADTTLIREKMEGKRGEIKSELEARPIKLPRRGETLFPEQQGLALSRSEGKKIARINFMATMAGLLGDVEKVKTHFKGIREVNIPEQKGDRNKLYLAKEAAERLEAARNNFKARNPGAVFPNTTVGQALRGRHQIRQGPGMFSHPLGYAIDYDAYNNPHLKGSRKIIEVATGGTARLVFKDKRGQTLSSVKSQTAKIGKETMAYHAKRQKDPNLPLTMPLEDRDPEGRFLLSQLDESHATMFKTSEDFKKSLPEPNIEELKKLANEKFWGDTQKDYSKTRGSVQSLEKKSAQEDKVYKKKAAVLIKEARRKVYDEAMTALREEDKMKRASLTRDERAWADEKKEREKALKAERDKSIGPEELQEYQQPGLEKEADKKAAVKEARKKIYDAAMEVLKEEDKMKRASFAREKTAWADEKKEREKALKAERDKSIDPEELQEYQQSELDKDYDKKAIPLVKKARKQEYDAAMEVIREEDKAKIKSLSDEKDQWALEKKEREKALKTERDKSISPEELQEYQQPGLEKDADKKAAIKAARKQKYDEAITTLREEDKTKIQSLTDEKARWALEKKEREKALREERDRSIEPDEIQEYRPRTHQEELEIQKEQLETIRGQFRPDLERLLQPYFEKIALLQEEIMSRNQDVPQEDWNKEDRSAMEELEALKWRLSNDLDFIFGSPQIDKKTKERTGEVAPEVDNPSVLQLLDRGFFQDSTRTGFTLEFFRVMIEHGFAPLAAVGAVDSMHFDFAEGLQNLFPGTSAKTSGPEGAK